jgi:hypothetical protein
MKITLEKAKKCPGNRFENLFDSAFSGISARSKPENCLHKLSDRGDKCFHHKLNWCELPGTLGSKAKGIF